MASSSPPLQARVIHVSNPGRAPLLFQPLLIHSYSHPNRVVDALAERMDAELQGLDVSHSQASFSIHQPPGLSLPPPALLPPSERYDITVAFTPKFDGLSSSLLLIRNNLTGLDYVLLRGRGSVGSFTIDGIQPSSEPLIFDFSMALLERCHSECWGRSHCGAGRPSPLPPQLVNCQSQCR